MNRYFIINILIFFFVSTISSTQSDWSSFYLNKVYPVRDKSNCVFPFTYKNKPYNDCINIDNDFGLPWCSITPNYVGLYTYCYDFRQPQFECLSSYKVGSKTFKGCDYLSASAIYKQCMTNSSDVPKMYCNVNELTSRTGKPLVHLNDCDQNYRKLSDYNSMCIGPSEYAIRVPIDKVNQADILDIHNYYRGQVTSTYMLKLYWDDDLAAMAQAHSDLCAFDHDQAGNRLIPKYKWLNGQNIMQGSDFRTSLSTLIDMMLGSEQPYFQYGEGCKNISTSCLHYTQAMIRNLNRVGCGQTHCLYPDRLERTLVCNYIQSQYQDSFSKPYIRSTVSQSDCPFNKTENLCDCGNILCRYDNNEDINPKTCKCEKSRHKRSLDTNEYTNRKSIGSKPFRILSDTIDSDSNRIKKRNIKFNSQNRIIQRSFREVIKFN